MCGQTVSTVRPPPNASKQPWIAGWIASCPGGLTGGVIAIPGLDALWRPTGEQVRSYRAPLILLPVKLERKSAASQPTLRAHDDDPVFNLTLSTRVPAEFRDIATTSLARYSTPRSRPGAICSRR